METFKFETLKKRVKENLPYLFNRHVQERAALASFAVVELVESGRIRQKRSGSFITALYDVFAQEAIPIIDRWDVRCAQSLAALIPNLVPSWVEHGRFTVDYDENCELVLYRVP